MAMEPETRLGIAVAVVAVGDGNVRRKGVSSVRWGAVLAGCTSERACGQDKQNGD